MVSCDFLDHSVHPDVQFGHQDVKVLYCEKGLYNFDPYVTCYIVTSVCYLAASIYYVVTTEWYIKIIHCGSWVSHWAQYYIVITEKLLHCDKQKR